DAWEVEPNLLPGEYDKWVIQEKQQEQQKIDQGYPLFDRFVESLQLCQFALSQNPLMTTASGLYQPRKRQQIIVHPEKTFAHPRIAIMHPQRTYADMHKQVAAELTNLGNFMARVRYIDANEKLVEGTIRTLDPKQHPDKPLFG